MIDYKSLNFWNESHKTVLDIILVLKNFPEEEKYALTLQMRKSAISIPSNISEGCGRNTLPHLKNFFQIAAGSAAELEYQLLLSYELGYISKEFFYEKADKLQQIRKMIYGYLKKCTSL